MDGMHTNSTAGVSGFSGIFRPPESFSMVPANPASLKGIACGLRSAIKHKYFEAIELRRPYNFSQVLLLFSGVVFAIQLDNLKMIQSSSVEGADDHKGQPSSSRTNNWSALKNPRIVRVTRAFGGKDRHSKVRTIRGLRDRRVRLSMPTAIQLYDLQDKLGFNQPSKVVDWLINAAQHEIDKLPPLEMLQGDPTIFSWVPQTANPDISTISCTHDHEHTNNNLIRIKEREATLNLGYHGVGSENSEATYNPYFQLENSSNGCLPITILASYLAAASNSTEAKQYAWPHSDQLFK